MPEQNLWLNLEEEVQQKARRPNIRLGKKLKVVHTSFEKEHSEQKKDERSNDDDDKELSNLK
ncbi:hypothetical protein GOP47_0010084 [Adiantum capillus-veneris]|uniref:Uncharacterized protein n=1 Tax=Adiantum capillus-veneris TaxID=13818 RepID=A0A9D4ZG05_ADICA|nr:hypothetical protein GOP47_0010084 [Adiantum capillus-veneris]